MRFDYMLIGLLVFAAVIVGGVMMINDFDQEYPDVNMSDANDSFTAVYANVDELYNQSSSYRDKVINTTITKSTSWESMLVGGYSAVRLIPKSFTIFHGIITGIAGTMRIQCTGGGFDSPSCMYIDLAFIAFVISLIFSIIYMLFRFIPK